MWTRLYEAWRNTADASHTVLRISGQICAPVETAIERGFAAGIEACAHEVEQQECVCFCLEDADAGFRGRIESRIDPDDNCEIREVVKHDPRCSKAQADKLREIAKE